MKSRARVNGPTSCRRHVVSLSHTTKSYRLNRPLENYSFLLQFFFSCSHSELENRAQLLEKDLYYYKKTSRDLKKKLREKMASGMGTSIESDVVVASGELEPQYRSTSDAHGKQLATEVSRMKVYLTIIPRARVGYEMIDSQRRAKRRVGYNHLMSNKCEWNDYFIKNNQEILLDFANFALQEQLEDNFMVTISRTWYNGSYTLVAKPIKSLELRYTMIQFLIIINFSLVNISLFSCTRTLKYGFNIRVCK